jgi:hypothetical protein
MAFPKWSAANNVTWILLPSAFPRAKIMMGVFSDGAVDLRHTRGIAIFPKMELEKRHFYSTNRQSRSGEARRWSPPGRDCDPEQGQRVEGPCAIPFVFFIACYY